MSSLELRHPESELLLPYLDGELPARKARQVRRHVEACWQCRAELEELEKTVGECMRYRRRLQESPLAQPPQPWSDLSHEFARIDAASRRSALWVRPLVRWGAFAAASAAVVAATLTLRNWNRPAAHVPQPPPQSSLVTQLPKPASSPVISSPAPPVRSREPRRQPVALEASLADELRAVAALHQMGADLGDPVEVAREGNRVVVRGAGVSPIREREIRKALVSLPHVEVQFAESPAVSPASPATTLSAPTAPPTATAMQSRLEAQLGGRTQFETFSAQLLDNQEAAMARIYALRRLASEFTPEAESGLNADNQRLLRDLAREHLQVLNRQIAAIDQATRPVLTPLLSRGFEDTASAAQNVRPVSWQAAAQELFASGRQVDSVTAVLLGASAPPPGETGPLPNAFLAALAQLRLSVQQCELLLMP
jgi:Putative zinc-finger